jgi:drug/metabolite transporter (DMT)-like permease
LTQTPAPSRAYLLTGAVLCGGAAMLFGVKGIFAKQLYAIGVSWDLLVPIRALLSLPLFWAFVVWREGLAPMRAAPPRVVLLAAIAGLFCYYVGAMTDFLALTMIEASLERSLLFSYPALVLLLQSVLTRSWPQPLSLAGAGATYVGIFLAVGGFDATELRANLFGAALVMVSAVSYAVYYLIGERCTRVIGSGLFTLFSMTAASIALLLHLIVAGDPSAVAGISGHGWLLLGALATLCMFFPALMQSEGMRRIGAQRGSVVSTLGPPTTLVAGWAFLGERLTATQIAGSALIVASVLAIELLRMAQRKA